MVASPALVPSPGNPQMTPGMGSSLRSVGEKQILVPCLLCIHACYYFCVPCIVQAQYPTYPDELFYSHSSVLQFLFPIKLNI